MKKKVWSFFYGFTFILTTILSCRFPYKIVPNFTDTPIASLTIAVKILNTPKPPFNNQTVTPSEEETSLLIETKPAIGSVLTWIDYSNFVFIPEGKYLIGKDSYDPKDFTPLHEVNLNRYWIQQTEVTNQQYNQCVQDGQCSPPIQEPEIPYWFEDTYDANHPVVGVSWFQAREYCAYIQSRLPTEAEWEVAARGMNAKIYPWGHEKPNCNYVNFKGCLEPEEPFDIGYYFFGASEFQVLDMAGNVFEWVGDWYKKDYYSSSPSMDPIGPLEGYKKVFRGGSYKSTVDEIASYLRFSTEPEKFSSDIGFRCVIDGDPIIDSTLKFKQPCQVVGISDQRKTLPTPKPFPCSSATVSGFCQRLGGKPSYGINISQSNCLDNELYSMIANSEPLSCNSKELPDGGKIYQCTFPGMAQGLNVKINYCHLFNIPEVETYCPIGYQINDSMNLCELENSKLPTPPCPQGYLNVKNVGCLPIYNPEAYGCPIGFYSTEIKSNSASVCIPLDNCQYYSELESCNNMLCGTGQKYDQNNKCCMDIIFPKKICGSNYIYNSEQNACIEPELYIKKCFSSNVNIPYCPTVTPSPTPIPPPNYGPVNCSVFTDPEICKSNGCTWAVGLFYCY